MCGIFVYINCNVLRERWYILEVFFNGLRCLEYCGYDFVGIFIDFDGDDGFMKLCGLVVFGFILFVFCEEGKIEKFVVSVYRGMFLKF